MRSITFEGRISGDMECFCWDDISNKDMKKLRPDFDKKWDTPGRAYPNDVFRALGHDYFDGDAEQRYKFTITIERVNPHD